MKHNYSGVELVMIPKTVLF